MKNRYRRTFRIVISLGFGFLLLWLITRNQDIGLLMQEFKEANYLWIFLAMIAALVSHVLRAMRWNLLIGAMGYQTKTTQTFYAVMTGYLANLAVPRMGEVTRCVVLSKAGKVPFNVLAGTVVSERAFDLFTMFVIVFLTIIFQFGFLKDFLNQVIISPLLARGAQNWIWLLLIIIAFAVLLLFFFLFFRNKLKNPRPETFFYKLKRQLIGFKSGIKTIAQVKARGWFLLSSILIWGLYYLTVYLCFFAIQATSHLSAADGMTLLVVGSLGILAPVPGGIGTFHFLIITTLTELYGIASEPATSYAYITHATQIAVNIIVGPLAWIMLSVKPGKGIA